MKGSSVFESKGIMTFGRKLRAHFAIEGAATGP